MTGFIKIILLLFIMQVTYVQADNFTIDSLPEASKKLMRDKGVWKDGCPVSLERLKVVKFSYYDFNFIEHHNGNIVVLDVVANNVVNIFREFHTLKFPIHKAQVIENYGGNDEESMTDNNSSCFNCREIVGGGLSSIHSYGLAIDINPVQNPYISSQDLSNKNRGLLKILPAAGYDYLNRTNIRLGMVEPIVTIFARNGFSIWGGKWNNPIDWQHFQPSRAMAQLLATMTYNDGLTLFNFYVKESKLLNSIDHNDNRFIMLYKKSPSLFIQCFKDLPNLLKIEPDHAYQVLSHKIN